MSGQTQPETALQSLAEKLRTDAIAIFGDGQAERDIIEWFYDALLAAAPAAPAAQGAVPDVSAMARVLSDRAASACSVDPDDNWKIYGQEYIEDVRAMLSAAPAHPAERQEQEGLHVWRATTRFGETCHFGEASTARAWAGENGTVERVDLTPVPELRVVERQEQGEVQRLRVHVCKLGRYGAAFDPVSTHYAYTYTDQPDNLGAGKLGRAALGINPGGDVIDAGLSLLDRLSREGFGVFQIAASTGQEGT